jgi:hypothetical protein
MVAFVRESKGKTAPQFLSIRAGTLIDRQYAATNKVLLGASCPQGRGLLLLPALRHQFSETHHCNAVNRRLALFFQ